MDSKIILASGSPRRQQILSLAGIPHEVIVSDADETISGEPEYQVKELALRKARAVLSMLEQNEKSAATLFFAAPKARRGGNASGAEAGCARCSEGVQPGEAGAAKRQAARPVREAHERAWGRSPHYIKTRIILAADTIVFIDGEVLGKPKNAAEAFQMLKTLSGRRHEVYTGVALLQGTPENQIVFADKASVFFRELSDEEIHAYIKTGEPFDKAGSYGVQERGAVLVDRIEGDFYTVVGLPISKVWTALEEMGCNTPGSARRNGQRRLDSALYATPNAPQLSPSEIMSSTASRIRSRKANRLCPAVRAGYASHKLSHSTGIGVDIVQVTRFEKYTPESHFIQKYFTTREREYLKNKKTQSIAGIFAAKEAVAKAIGTGFSGFSPVDIEILHRGASGSPYVVLHSGAKKIMRKFCRSRKFYIHISISHSTETAIAYAMISVRTRI